MPIQFADRGVIIRRIPIGEADLMVSVFTRHRGRLGLIAKGVRKLTSRRGGHLDLFNLVELQGEERGAWRYLNEVTVVEAFDHIKSSEAWLERVFHLSELVDHLFPEADRYVDVFDALVQTLHQANQDISTGQCKLGESLVREFEVCVLKALGYWSVEVQGARYPQLPSEQKMFNQGLIQEVSSRKLKGDQVWRQLGKLARNEKKPSDPLSELVG